MSGYSRSIVTADADPFHCRRGGGAIFCHGSRLARWPAIVTPIAVAWLQAEAIPGLQYQAPRSVLAILLCFALFQYAERFAWELGAVDIGRIEHIAQFVAREPVEGGIVSVQLGPQNCAALLIPAEGWTVAAEVVGERLEVPGRVGQLQHAQSDKVEVGGVVSGRWHNGDLLQDVIRQVRPAQVL